MLRPVVYRGLQDFRVSAAPRIRSGRPFFGDIFHLPVELGIPGPEHVEIVLFKPIPGSVVQRDDARVPVLVRNEGHFPERRSRPEPRDLRSVYLHQHFAGREEIHAVGEFSLPDDELPREEYLRLHEAHRLPQEELLGAFENMHLGKHVFVEEQPDFLRKPSGNSVESRRHVDALLLRPQVRVVILHPFLKILRDVLGDHVRVDFFQLPLPAASGYIEIRYQARYVRDYVRKHAHSEEFHQQGVEHLDVAVVVRSVVSVPDGGNGRDRPVQAPQIMISGAPVRFSGSYEKPSDNDSVDRQSEPVREMDKTPD